MSSDVALVVAGKVKISTESHAATKFLAENCRLNRLGLVVLDKARYETVGWSQADEKTAEKPKVKVGLDQGAVGVNGGLGRNLTPVKQV